MSTNWIAELLKMFTFTVKFGKNRFLLRGISLLPVNWNTAHGTLLINLHAAKYYISLNQWCSEAPSRYVADSGVYIVLFDHFPPLSFAAAVYNPKRCIFKAFLPVFI